jgi:transcriptional regulator with XRE-family HTH domain
LRNLRETAGLSQLAVELEADLGSGYLHKVELGKIKSPLKETLERILAAVGARHSDRRDALEAFGYNLAASLPTTAEIEWALKECGPAVQQVAMPAYLLDCALRPLLYNGYLCALLGASPNSKEMTGVLHRPIFEQVFDSESWLFSRFNQHEDVLPILMMTLHIELVPYLSEKWCQELVEGCMRLPLFKKYWEEVKQRGPYNIVASPLLPVQINSPLLGEITCRTSVEYLKRDSRFRVIYLIPVDQTSVDRLGRWASTERDAQKAG